MQMTAKLLNGDSIFACMSPNEQHQSIPKYSESMHLPYIIIEGERFWAKSHTGHAGGYSNTLNRPITFAYTNAFEIFASYNLHVTNVMNRRLYESFMFNAHPNYRLLYETGDVLDRELLDHLLTKGSEFKVALLDHEERWYIYPVGQLYKFSETADIEIHTSMDFFPKICTEFSTVETMINDYPKIFADTLDHLSMEGSDLMLGYVDEPYSTYMRIHMDNTYHTLEPTGLSDKKNYKKIRLFYAKDTNADD